VMVVAQFVIYFMQLLFYGQI